MEMCRPVKFFHTDPILTNHFYMDPHFVHGGIVMLKQERANPYNDILESSRMSFYAVELRFHFTGTKGPSPNHDKQPHTIIPPPKIVTVGTMHWAGCFSKHPPNPDCRTARW
jgi:hypothetical protein